MASKAGNTWVGSELPFDNLDLLWLGPRPKEGSLVNQQKPRREMAAGALKLAVRGRGRAKSKSNSFFFSFFSSDRTIIYPGFAVL